MSLLPILAANAMLLAGLVWLDWEPGTLAFLFWFEAAAVGAVTLLKLAASVPGAELTGPQRVTYVRRPRPGGYTSVSSTLPRIGKLAAVPLFVLSYGLLLLGYAALLLASLEQADYPHLVAAAWASHGARFAMALIAGQHLWGFWRDFVRGPAWQRSDPTFHFWSPFGLAMLLWLGFFLGFVILGWLHGRAVVLVVLIVLKTIAEAFRAAIDAQAGAWERLEPDD
jgi:Family of unknown function (DUF6498)